MISIGLYNWVPMGCVSFLTISNMIKHHVIFIYKIGGFMYYALRVRKK